MCIKNRNSWKPSFPPRQDIQNLRIFVFELNSTIIMQNIIKILSDSPRNFHYVILIQTFFSVFWKAIFQNVIFTIASWDFLFIITITFFSLDIWDKNRTKIFYYIIFSKFSIGLAYQCCKKLRKKRW